jgi:Secretion system C-terminal sorting domain/Putative metal-binding motif
VVFTLTGTGNSPCTTAADQVSITFNSLVNYYPDVDGDGYGSAAVLPTPGCSPPVGYVGNNGDQCDSNNNINAGTEWWYDADGDGYGSFVYEYGNAFSGCSFPDPDGAGPAQFIPYHPASNGNATYLTDCNDDDPLMFPGIEICNGLDDDCDGLIDEGGCAPLNDIIQNAQLVGTTNPISQCTITAGTTLNANNSTESTSTTAVGGGRDVWYRFVASASNTLIKVFGASGFNPMIELRTGPINATVLVDTENAGTGNWETMVATGLTPGATYYYAVIAYDNVTGGVFNTCVSSFTPSGCVDGQATSITNCQTFKFKSVGATNYTVVFTPVMGSVGGGSITTTSSFSTGSALLSLVPGNSYNVTVAANFTVVDAGGASQIVTVNSNSPSCTLFVVSLGTIEVRTTQWCSVPATLLRSSYLRTDPFICGVTNYSFEFTPMNACTGGTSTGLPFTHTNVSRVIPLNFTGATTVPSGQVITNQTYYQVRIRPNYGPGGIYPGTYGAPRVIYIGGTLLEEMEETYPEPMEGVENVEALMMVYPNPNNGNHIFLSVEQLQNSNAQVEVLDAQGRLVFSNKYASDGSLQVDLLFERPLESGLYLVRVKDGDLIRSQRMLVTK